VPSSSDDDFDRHHHRRRRQQQQQDHPPPSNGDGDRTASTGSNDEDDECYEDDESDSDESYESVLRRYASRGPRLRRTLWQLCSASLVVVQEVCLTCYLLARHRVATTATATATTTAIIIIPSSSAIERSTIAMYAALALVLLYNNNNNNDANKKKMKSDRRGGEPQRQQQQQQSRRTKVRQRAVDGALLAALLRLLASLLRSLTASYSSDTVQMLARIGMVVHVLACDYSYANGGDGNDNDDDNTGSNGMTMITHGELDHNDNDSTTTKGTDKDDDEGRKNGNNIHNSNNRRPSFRGGTVSFNAALFATTLLASRLNESSSNYSGDDVLSAYLFVSVAVVVFAFYPVTRNAVAASHPPESSRTYMYINYCRGSPYSTCTAFLENFNYTPWWSWSFSRFELFSFLPTIDKTTDNSCYVAHNDRDLRRNSTPPFRRR